MFLYKQYSLTFVLTAIRASDVMLVLIIFYGLALTLIPTLSPSGTLVLHFSHALAWCIIHYFGFGMLLRAQSKHKFLVRNLKNYHYSKDEEPSLRPLQTIYNLSMCMTYGRTNSFLFTQDFVLTCFKFHASVLSGNRILFLVIRQWDMSFFFHILCAVCVR